MDVRALFKADGRFINHYIERRHDNVPLVCRHSVPEVNGVLFDQTLKFGRPVGLIIQSDGHRMAHLQNIVEEAPQLDDHKLAAIGSITVELTAGTSYDMGYGMPSASDPSLDAISERAKKGMLDSIVT
jgi:hypothetical protein